MNGPIYLGWLVVIILAATSIVLLMGKGSFLMAGFNTLDKEEKEKYNTKRLCLVVGGGFSLLTVIVGAVMYFEGELPEYLQWIMPYGFLTIIVVIAILANTICKKK